LRKTNVPGETRILSKQYIILMVIKGKKFTW